MNIRVKILQLIDFVSKSDSLKIILFISVIHRLFYFLILNHFKLFYTPDSVTYFVPVSFFKGQVDLLRTPVYPELINLLEFIFRDKLIASIVIFQNVFSLLSIIPFHSIVSRLFANKGIVFLSTLFYGCSSLLIDQCANINPEGICLAASTFYLYILFNFFEKNIPGKRTAFMAGFAPVFLVMLKPTYLAMPLILTLLIPNLALFKIRLLKKTDMYFFAGLALCFICIWGYAEVNKRQNGEFALTKVSDINNFSNIIISGGYKYGGDKEFIDIIDTSKSKGYYYSTFLIINNVYDHRLKCEERYSKYLPLDDKMAKGVEMFKTKTYPFERISQFIINSSKSMVHKRFLAGKILTIFRVYWDIALVMLANMLFFILAYYKRNTINYFSLFCVLFVFSQFITIAIAGIYNWDRVLIPSHTFILLIIGFLLDTVMKARFLRE